MGCGRSPPRARWQMSQVPWQGQKPVQHWSRYVVCLYKHGFNGGYTYVNQDMLSDEGEQYILWGVCVANNKSYIESI